MEEQEDDGEPLPGSGPEPGSDELASRLKAAVKDAGGNSAVAQRSGVPLSTLNSYLRGVEMKVGGLVRLAAATGVRLEWLATGTGPTRPGEGLLSAGSGLGEAAQAQDIGLTWQTNPDRIAKAYVMALNGFVVLEGHRPDPKRLMQVTLLLYDELTDAEAQGKSPPNAR